VKMNSIALIVVLAVFNGRPALACNRTNPNPLDMSCPTTIYLDNVFGSVSYYANNGPARFAQITACTHPNPFTPPNPRWCAAAMQAQRYATGAR
jgi:hypothetical protein